MKHVIALLGLSIFLLQITYAQNGLPNVPKSEIKNCAIEGTYIPKGEFSSMFPSFASNGTYAFDYAFVIPNEFHLDHDGFYGLHNFTNRDFPAFESKSTNSFQGLGRIIVQFSPATFSGFRIDRDNMIHSQFDLQNPKLYALNKDAKESYDNMNQLFKLTTSKLFESKQANRLKIVDMGNLELQDSVLSQSDLIFQFIYVQSNTWMQSETAKKFPSHSLYQLIVKTINGDTLGVYGQAIFYEGKQSKFSRPFQTEHFIMSVTFPIAFENLINRFLNDTRTIDRINQYNQTIFAKSQNNKRLDSIIKLLNRFDFIRSKVDQVKYDLACLGIDYNSTAQSVQESKQTLDESKQLYGDNPVVQFSSFISGAIFSGQDKKALARNNEKLVILKSRSVEISEEENELIKYMTDHNVQSSAINVILKSRVLDETTLSTIIDNLNAKQADISGQIK